MFALILTRSSAPAATGWAAHAHPFEFANGPIEYAPDIRRFLNGTPNVPAMYSARSGYEIVNEIGVACDSRQVAAPDATAHRSRR